MRYLASILLLLIVGCSKAPDADLASIATARSLGAEWALVN
jgi:Tfp pilus assembly protein PilP